MAASTETWNQPVPLWLAAWAVVLALLIGYWAGSFARSAPDRWHFDRSAIVSGDYQFLIRVDNQTGKTEVLLGQGGWRELPLTPPLPIAK